MTTPKRLEAIEKEWADDDGPAHADIAFLLSLVKEYRAALEEIKARTHSDEAEGLELRAQNAANYRAACLALRRGEEISK